MVDSWWEDWLEDIGVPYGVTFNFGKVCSPAILETCFSAMQ